MNFSEKSVLVLRVEQHLLTSDTEGDADERLHEGDERGGETAEKELHEDNQGPRRGRASPGAGHLVATRGEGQDTVRASYCCAVRKPDVVLHFPNKESAASGTEINSPCPKSQHQ